MAPALEAFDHVHVFVADRAAAERWYQRVLGLRPTPQLAFWAADGGPLTLQNATGSIHLALFEREPRPCRSTIALRATASEYRAWKRHLAQELPQGVTEEDHRVSISLYFADPDGNPFEITTYDIAGAPAAGRTAPAAG